MPAINDDCLYQNQIVDVHLVTGNQVVRHRRYEDEINDRDDEIAAKDAMIASLVSRLDKLEAEFREYRASHP